ncbi:MAG: TIGR04255 family protein [Planctomycetes bacterium]|nr:TIGR04255 family protein [Planctomycetota bacterium]
MDASPETTQRTGSPRFKNPPVVETALGIQFAELADFKTSHFGLFYEHIRDRYPIVKDQPRLDPIIETFPKAPRIPQFKVRTTPRPERVWYENSEEGSRLVQLQPDRFGFNWRKPSPDDAPYPSYLKNSRLCLDEFARFLDMCKAEGFQVQPDVCEVVYVNQIWPQAGESLVELFATVFSGISWQASDDWLPAPELVTLNRVFEIGQQQGRLYAEAGMATQKDGGDCIALKVTGRVLHQSGDPAGVEQSLKLAHDWVVNGFVSLTNATIRKERWGQTA